MNRSDYRALSDDGLAQVVNLEQRVAAMTKTVEEQQATIAALQADNQSLRSSGLIDLREMRRQLAESEGMRSEMSAALQRERARAVLLAVLCLRAVRGERIDPAELRVAGIGPALDAQAEAERQALIDLSERW